MEEIHNICSEEKRFTPDVKEVDESTPGGSNEMRSTLNIEKKTASVTLEKGHSDKVVTVVSSDNVNHITTSDHFKFKGKVFETPTERYQDFIKSLEDRYKQLGVYYSLPTERSRIRCGVSAVLYGRGLDYQYPAVMGHLVRRPQPKLGLQTYVRSPLVEKILAGIDGKPEEHETQETDHIVMSDKYTDDISNNNNTDKIKKKHKTTFLSKLTFWKKTSKDQWKALTVKDKEVLNVDQQDKENIPSVFQRVLALFKCHH